METIWVLIVSDSPTFSDGLKNLLLPQSQLAIIGQERDVSHVTNFLKKVTPDVIIWADTGLTWNLALDEIGWLAATLSSKIISLNFKNNEIAIYQPGQKTVRVIEDIQDLIETIEEDFPSKQPVPQLDNFAEQFVASGQPISQPV
ncbi:MAG: hypothetical protein KJ077_38185 [Anaerolineae bacterium]|nr:hypothetical protein [Anaerolineae bacterium]